MLRKENKSVVLLILLMILTGCTTKNTDKQNLIENNLFKISQNIVNKEQYFDVYNKLNDSLNTWSLNNLGYYQYCGKSKNCFIDSLLCFNTKGNRFVTGKLMQQLLKEGVADDIDFILGEKINNQWYFFSGANIFIPRSMVANQPLNKPLSYAQLHQIALKEVYGGYLNKDGTINEHWFISHFEGAGWVNWDDTPEKIKSYTRKDYEQFHLKVIRNNWNGVKKDSIKQLQKKDEALP